MWQVLSEAIDILQAKGYRLVTLAECLGKEPYQNVGQRGQKDVSTYLAVPAPSLTSPSELLAMLSGPLANCGSKCNQAHDQSADGLYRISNFFTAPRPASPPS